MDDNHDTALCYVSVCPECSSVVAATIRDPTPDCTDPKGWRKDVARFVSGAAKRGYTIETVTVSEARKRLTPHTDKCPNNWSANRWPLR